MNLTDILNTVQRTKESHSNLDKTMFKTALECLINGPICSAIFTHSCHNYNKFFEGFNDLDDLFYTTTVRIPPQPSCRFVTLSFASRYDLIDEFQSNVPFVVKNTHGNVFDITRFAMICCPHTHIVIWFEPETPTEIVFTFKTHYYDTPIRRNIVSHINSPYLLDGSVKYTHGMMLPLE